MTAARSSRSSKTADAVAEDIRGGRTLLERKVRLVLTAVAALVAASGAAMVLAGVDSPARPYILAVGFVLGSGWAVSGWLTLPAEPAYVGTVTLGVGFAIPIAVSIILIEARWWHPVGASGVLLAVAAGVNGLLGLRTLLQPSPSPATAGRLP